jgi:hypothetical protein
LGNLWIEGGEMILTGKATEFAEDFEKLEKAKGDEGRFDEINECEQMVLFMINKMFMKEAAFRKFIGDATIAYGIAQIVPPKKENDNQTPL